MLSAPVKSAWQFIHTPPLTGAENMLYDLNSLHKVQDPTGSPIVRFFRWIRPTVSYGKHQSLEKFRSLIPEGWDTVQRPTGGGIVFHDQDLCLSLCWRSGQAPLPEQLKDHYAWIHGIIAEALRPLGETRLADCRDCTAPTAFESRDCFTQPVAYDVLTDQKKIVGGALCRQRNALLYQGSIQAFDSNFESRLSALLKSRLQS
jgi:lipoate-protein ligase A